MSKSKVEVTPQIRQAFLRALLSDATPGEIKHLPATVNGIDGYVVSVFFPAECSFSSMAFHSVLTTEAEFVNSRKEFFKKIGAKDKHERRKTR